MLTMCNGEREGDGCFITPGTRVNDGIFDYAMIFIVSWLKMLRLLLQALKGTHTRCKDARLGHFRHLQLEADRPITVYADGEVFADFDSDIDQL